MGYQENKTLSHHDALNYLNIAEQCEFYNKKSAVQSVIIPRFN